MLKVFFASSQKYTLMIWKNKAEVKQFYSEHMLDRNISDGSALDGNAMQHFIPLLWSN